LLADDLGIGEVGAWGQQEITTPHIDRLAREGMRFTEFRSSAAVCGPARCSLMTGLHNGTCRLDDNDNDYLRTEDVTLAERLHDAGYVTGLFGKWGLSWDREPESWPNAQGFDEFFGYRDQVHAHIVRVHLLAEVSVGLFLSRRARRSRRGGNCRDSGT
jgi:arylsulfatase A-like enzyme